MSGLQYLERSLWCTISLILCDYRVSIYLLVAVQMLTDLAEHKGRYDRIICDPPFLSDDCQTKGERHPVYLQVYSA
jgi:hypothetical protein